MQAISNSTALLPASASRAQVEAQPLIATTEKPAGVWQEGEISFSDILDAINPLQHIPVISTIYQKLTGDEMGYASRIAGDTLYGGVFGSFISGLASALANVFVDATTGKDIAGHVIAAASPAPEAPLKQHAALSSSRTVPDLPGTELMTELRASPGPQIELSTRDVSRLQAAIETYKWQMLADSEKQRSNFWG